MDIADTRTFSEKRQKIIEKQLQQEKEKEKQKQHLLNIKNL